MLDKNGNYRVFLKMGRTDMRKSINGLAVEVQVFLKQNPFDKSLFVFCNKRRNQIKILYWDMNGFCLWQKRLEKDKYMWLKSGNNSMEISMKELEWLLEGLDYRKAYKPLSYELVA